MKRVAVVPYSLASVQKMSPWIEDVQREMVEKLGRYADDGKICNLGDLLHWFAFDVRHPCFQFRFVAYKCRSWESLHFHNDMDS